MDRCHSNDFYSIFLFILIIQYAVQDLIHHIPAKPCTVYRINKLIIYFSMKFITILSACFTHSNQLIFKTHFCGEVVVSLFWSWGIRTDRAVPDKIVESRCPLIMGPQLEVPQIDFSEYLALHISYMQSTVPADCSCSFECSALCKSDCQCLKLSIPQMKNIEWVTIF